MNCNSCGKQISVDAQICPHCGRTAPLYYAASGADPDASTMVRRPSGGMPGNHDLPLPGVSTSHISLDPYSPSVPPPPPSYDSNSSVSLPPSVYNLSSSLPYTVPPTAAPPVRRQGSGLLKVGVLLLVGLLLVGGGFFYVSRSSSEKVTGQSQSLPATVQHSAASAPVPPVTGDAQTVYKSMMSRNPVLASSLNGPDNYGWDDYAQAGTHCWFTGGAYHSKAAPKYFSPCYAQATNFSNFLFQAGVTMLSGHSGGLVFRADSKNDNGYYFRVSTDGTYILNKLSPNNLQPLLSGTNAVIKQGTNQANVLAVLAQGNRLSLFINGKYIESTTDNSYQAGQIGVYVDSDAGNVEAGFHQAQVWNV
jgi:hypothetical protein